MDIDKELKEDLIAELVDILAAAGALEDRDTALSDVLNREKTMSTGMQHGIALPHAKTEGVTDMAVAVGIKREGIDFDSLDGEKSRIFILVVSPRKISGPHIQFLAAIGAVLNNEEVRRELISTDSKDRAAALLRSGPGKR